MDKNPAVAPRVGKNGKNAINRELSALSGRTRGESLSSSELEGVDATRVKLMSLGNSVNPFGEAGKKGVTRHVLLIRISDLVKLLKSCEVLDNVEELQIDFKQLFRWIRPLVMAEDSLVRTVAFRVMRHSILEREALDAMLDLRIHLFIVRSLDCEESHELERMEALKLVRKMLEMDYSMIPRGVVRSLVAIAMHPDDGLRGVVLETLRQLAMQDTLMVAECQGIRAIVQAIVDPKMKAMAPALTLSLLHLLGNEKSRKAIRMSFDISPILSPLTDSQVERSSAELDACSDAIILFLKTWTGLYALTTDPNGLRSLIEILVQPVNLQLRQKVMEMIFTAFLHLCPFDVFTTTNGGSFMNSNRGYSDDDEDEDEDEESTTFDGLEVGLGMHDPPVVKFWGLGPNAASAKHLSELGFSSEHFPRFRTQPHAVMCQFLVMTLLAFTGRGLVEALVEVIVKDDPPLSKLAAHLLAFLMRLSERLLPESRHWKLFNMANLVELASRLGGSEGKQDIEARRASRMVAFFCELTGSSYESSMATIRAQHTYIDAASLFSELDLTTAPISEGERQNVGICARGRIASMPYEAHLVTSVMLEEALGEQNAQQQQQQRSASPASSRKHRPSKSPMSTLLRRRRSSGGSKDPQRSVLSTMASQLLKLQSEGFGDISCQALLNLVGKNHQGGHLRVQYPLSNRGHRRDVRTAILTDYAYHDQDHLQILLAQSKVLQTKHWASWNWTKVDEIVHGPMRHHGLMLEIMKTKFAKRILGFFRAANVGEFIVLPLKTEYLPHVVVAVSMICVMLDFTECHEFLRQDRRGRLHRQIIEALRLEVNISNVGQMTPQRVMWSSFFSVGGEVYSGNMRSALNPGSSSTGSSGSKKHDEPTSPDGLRLLSPIACSKTMARGLFPILGAYMSHEAGVRLLEESQLFVTLDTLSTKTEKDYLVINVISHMDLAASERCRMWLQGVLQGHQISDKLRFFIMGYFRALIRRDHVERKEDVSRWLFDMIVSQLKFSGAIAVSAVSILNEAVYYPAYMKVVQKILFDNFQPMLDLKFARPFFFKFATTRSGFHFLQNIGWIERITERWQQVESLKYAARFETLLTSKLIGRNEPLIAMPKSYEKTGPKVFDEGFDVVFGMQAARKATQDQLVAKPADFHPQLLPLRAFEATATPEQGFSASDILSLMRLSWTVEVWVRRPDGSAIYVPMDTYLDASQLTGPEFGVDEMISMAGELHGDEKEGFGSRGTEITNRNLCVVAVPYLQESINIEDGMSVYAALTLGGDPVKRNGIVTPPPVDGGGFASDQSRTERAKSTERLRFTSDSGPPTAYVKRESIHGDLRIKYGLTTRAKFEDLENKDVWVCLSRDRIRSRIRDAAPGQRVSVCPNPNSPATFTCVKPENDQITASFESLRFHLALNPDCPNAPYIPSHFFGEIAKTSAGAKYLLMKKIPQDALAKVSDDKQPGLVRRAALWTLGHLGSSQTGLALLLDDVLGGAARVFHMVAEIALESPCIPLRGAAFNCLGLFSRTVRGRKLLQELYFDVKGSEGTNFGNNVVPRGFIFRFGIVTTEPKYTNFLEGTLLEDWKSILEGIESVDEAIALKFLKAVSNMINRISHKDAHNIIGKLRTHPEIFHSPVIFLRVHDLLANFSYDLLVRRFTLNQFRRRMNFDRKESWDALDRSE